VVSKVQKLLRRLRQTRRAWDEADLRKLLVGCGFRVYDAGHAVYEHEDYADLTLTIPRRKDLPPVYAQRALRMIDEVLERTQGAEDE
jgi:hypothetical protein